MFHLVEILRKVENTNRNFKLIFPSKLTSQTQNLAKNQEFISFSIKQSNSHKYTVRDFKYSLSK